VCPAQSQIYLPESGDNVACRSLGDWEAMAVYSEQKNYADMQRIIDSCPKLETLQPIKLTGKGFRAPVNDKNWTSKHLLEIEVREGTYWVDNDTIIGLPGDEKKRDFKKGEAITFWDKPGYMCSDAKTWRDVHRGAFSQNENIRNALLVPFWTKCWDGNRGEIIEMKPTGKKIVLDNPKGYKPVKSIFIEVIVTKVQDRAVFFKIGDTKWINAYSALRKSEARLP